MSAALDLFITASHTQAGLGYDIRLFCTVLRSNPDLEGYAYVWRQFNRTRRFGRYDGTLILKNLVREDFGVYQCSVSNLVVEAARTVTISLVENG